MIHRMGKVHTNHHKKICPHMFELSQLGKTHSSVVVVVMGGHYEHVAGHCIMRRSDTCSLSSRKQEDGSYGAIDDKGLLCHYHKSSSELDLMLRLHGHLQVPWYHGERLLMNPGSQRL